MYPLAASDDPVSTGGEAGDDKPEADDIGASSEVAADDDVTVSSPTSKESSGLIRVVKASISDGAV